MTIELQAGPRPGRRPFRAAVLLWICVVLLAGAVGAWAGRATLVPAHAPDDTATPAAYRVAEGEVGRSIRFPAAASWSAREFAPGLAEGTLTGVSVTEGQLVQSGTVLYTVDLRPVVIMEGPTPAFRDLSIGVDGPDVAQLRAYLRSAGHLQTTVESSRFDRATSSAVQRWQRSLGITPDGVVRSADVIFVPDLPVRVHVADVVIGQQVGPGTSVVSGTESSPTFTVTLAAEQASTVPTEGPVTVTGGGKTWPAVIGAAERIDANLVLTLTGVDGGAVCGAECDAVVPASAGAATVFQVDVTVAPEVSGPLVPIAAIGVSASGSHVVSLADGTVVPVEILGSSDGVAVVRGVDVGDEVLLVAPGDPGGEGSEDG